MRPDIFVTIEDGTDELASSLSSVNQRPWSLLPAVGMFKAATRCSGEHGVRRRGSPPTAKIVAVTAA
jgi:hypothetical protein